MAPEPAARKASELGETLRKAVAQLAIANRESIAADHLTASVAIASGRVQGGIDRVNLMTGAIAGAQGAAAAGGNRVVRVNAR